MAETINLAEAVVEIVSDPTKIYADFKEILAKGETFAVAMKTVIGNLLKVAVPVGVGMAIFEIGKQALESAVHIEHLSQKLGMSTESLSRLEYAGKTVNVSIDDISRAVGLLAKQMIKGVDETGQQSKALEHLGLSARNQHGQLKSTEVMLGEIADKFSRVEDGTAKTAIAMEIFGRGGKDMIPLLNLGKEGLEELAKAADDAGYTLSEDAAKRAHELDVQIILLKLGVAGLAREILDEVVPALTVLTATFRDTTKEADGLVTAETTQLEYFTQINVILTAVAVSIRSIIGAIIMMAKVSKLLNDQILGMGGIKDIFRTPLETGQRMLKIWQEYEALLKRIGQKGVNALEGVPKNPNKKPELPVDAAMTDQILKANRAAEATILRLQMQAAEIDHNVTLMRSYRDQLILKEAEDMKANHVADKTIETYKAVARALNVKIDAKAALAFTFELQNQLRTLHSALLSNRPFEKAALDAHNGYEAVKKWVLDQPLLDAKTKRRVLALNETALTHELLDIQKRRALEMAEKQRELDVIINSRGGAISGISEASSAEKRFNEYAKWASETLTSDFAFWNAMAQNAMAYFLEIQRLREGQLVEFRSTNAQLDDIIFKHDLTQQQIEIRGEFVRYENEKKHIASLGLLGDEAKILAEKNEQAHIAALGDIDEAYATGWQSLLKRIGRFVVDEQRKLAEEYQRLAEDLVSKTADTFGESFWDAITGKAKDAKAAIRNFFRDMLKEIVMFMARQEVLKFFGFLGGAMNASSGGGGWMSLLGSVFSAWAGSSAGGGAASGGSGFISGSISGGAGSGWNFGHNAEGGIVRSPMISSLAEHGPEGVVPLSRGRYIDVKLTKPAGGDVNVTEHRKIVIVADPRQMKTSPGEIVDTVVLNIMRGDEIFDVIRRRMPR